MGGHGQDLELLVIPMAGHDGRRWRLAAMFWQAAGPELHGIIVEQSMALFSGEHRQQVEVHEAFCLGNLTCHLKPVTLDSFDSINFDELRQVCIS